MTKLLKNPIVIAVLALPLLLSLSGCYTTTASGERKMKPMATGALAGAGGGALIGGLAGGGKGALIGGVAGAAAGTIAGGAYKSVKKKKANR